ncbi:MAG TPA: SRPBCC family protein [Acidimicrobiales bacterium]|jgi:hypothetical protein|nr:SRPBCC family protein [Acidimicrobiales bacterium]
MTEENNPDTPSTYEKKEYSTFVVEREINVPRSAAWEVLLELIEKNVDGYLVEGDPAPHGLGAVIVLPLPGQELREEVISFEPPWRRVYEISGAPLNLYQGTTSFTDQEDGCLMVWSLLIDPLPGGESDGFIELSQQVITAFVDQIKITAESSVK